jgi:hypothetical protein
MYVHVHHQVMVASMRTSVLLYVHIGTCIIAYTWSKKPDTTSASATYYSLTGALQCMHMHINICMYMYLLCNKTHGRYMIYTCQSICLLHIDHKQLAVYIYAKSWSLSNCAHWRLEQCLGMSFFLSRTNRYIMHAFMRWSLDWLHASLLLTTHVV